MIKSKLHFPTESFGFVETEVETETIQDAIELYNASKTPQNVTGQGLDTKVFNDALTEYLNTNELRGGLELYNQMNEKQQFVFQELKKAFKRIMAKQLKDNEE